MQTIKPSHIILLFIVLIIFVVFVVLQAESAEPVNDIRDARRIAYTEARVLTLDSHVSAMIFIDDTLYIGSSREDVLIAIDVNTQERMLTLDYPVTQLAYDMAQELIYVVGNGRNRNSILALDRQHNILWENESMNDYRIPIDFYVNQDGGGFVWLPTGELALLNTEIGAYVPIVNQPTIDPELYYAEAGYFWRVLDGRLEARSVENANEVAWVSSLDSLPVGITRQVWFDGNQIILTHDNTLYLVDYPSGTLRWQTNTAELASNFVVSDGKIIALDVNASLLELDFSTGEVINQNDFEPPQEDARSSIVSDSTIGGSLIATNNNYTAIYFSDIRTLYIFAFTETE